MIKILIADDEKNLRKVLINELSETGLSCTETDSGIKAMDLLKKEEYEKLLSLSEKIGAMLWGILSKIKT